MWIRKKGKGNRDFVYPSQISFAVGFLLIPRYYRSSASLSRSVPMHIGHPCNSGDLLLCMIHFIGHMCHSVDLFRCMVLFIGHLTCCFAWYFVRRSQASTFHLASSVDIFFLITSRPNYALRVG